LEGQGEKALSSTPIGPSTDQSSETPLTSSTTPGSSKAADSHKGEGFLKSAWHKLTHQHDNLPPDEPKTGSKTDEKSETEEPKKAAGSS
jgi:molecular chaperone DnaJ